MAASVDLPPSMKYFCHQCCREVSPIYAVELTCPDCSSGFIEEVSSALTEAEEEFEEQFAEQFAGMHDVINGSLLRRILSRIPDRDEAGEDARESELLERLEQQETIRNELPDIIQELINGPLDLGDESYRFRYLGDYILGDDLDAFTTQLLNESEISGPPPLPSEQIKQLPLKGITKEQVDKGVQCTICMDDFFLREKAKYLPCDHFYHEKCINPWLERHATCPNCRKAVTVQSRSRRSQSCPRSSVSERQPYSESSSSTSSSLSDFLSTSINPFRFLH